MSQKLWNRVAGTILAVALFFAISPGVLAAEPHEDPEAAAVVFNGISLFRYYSASLDFVLQKKPDEVEARLRKMPFANVPAGEATDSFVSSSIGTSRLIDQIDQALAEFRALLQQYRLGEATQLADEILARLSQGDKKLDEMGKAMVLTAGELEVFDAPVQSDLRRSYDEVLERIKRLRGMVDGYRDVLKQPYSQSSLRLTELTLDIEPRVAFVGDNVSFRGRLISGKKPLVRREVILLLNSSEYATVTTDDTGYFRGEFPIPYWYLPELDIHALYYPQGKDIGLYLASLSPVIKLPTLFYPAELKIEVKDKAYRGRETVITGRFNYGQSPSLSQRKAEVYLDNVLVAEVRLEETFTQKIKVPAGVAPGKHTLTLSAAAAQRYAPVVASTRLDVTRANPTLELSLAKMVIIPGNLKLSGRLSSELGPVGEASIKIEVGNAQIELASSATGAFDARMGLGMSFGLIGLQDLVVTVIPREAWHAPLSTTRRLLTVNIINSSAFLLLLVFLGLYLPGRLKSWGRYPAVRVKPDVARVPAVFASNEMTPVTTLKESNADSPEPRNRVFYWYRLAVRLILGITRALLKPQQTLREFAQEHSQALGLKAGYFIELTSMVERVLYSQYRPTETDVEASERLSRKIAEESKPEAIR